MAKMKKGVYDESRRVLVPYNVFYEVKGSHARACYMFWGPLYLLYPVDPLDPANPDIIGRLTFNLG